ncbi:hypothetical protein BaRGS_00038442 [Batillaria attramentaria]|uniref:Uncharacterized protein n=1 Tax=Batillaria attramentaria TaxID=370345 RepID=A0ABD0J637_9CAEN
MFRLVLAIIACAASAVTQHPTVDELLHGDVITDYSPYEKTWADFKTAFDRQYGSSEEEDYRKQLFMDNIKEFEAHNKDYMNGKTTYWKDINQFTDMTDEEFASHVHLEPKESTAGRVKRQSFGVCSQYTPPTTPTPPASWDWRSRGYVSPVKDQGNCGSCWAFTTAGAMESRLRILTNLSRSDTLSEQQMVDCFAQNCKGNYPERAYEYLNRTGGIMSDAAYPYTSGSTRTNQVVAEVTGCQYTTHGDETAMKSAVYFQGPLSVIIYVTPAFRAYAGGIFDDPNCVQNSSNRTHCLLIVGYGTSGTGPFWIAKNSWGTTRGLKGYWLMRRGANTCSLASWVNFPQVTPKIRQNSGAPGGAGGTKSIGTGPSGKLLLVIGHSVLAFLITTVSAKY